MSLSFRSRITQLSTILAVLVSSSTLILAGDALAADDLAEASKLVRQGQYAPALERVDIFLAANPRDAQGRFLKGIILTEQNKTADAIAVFTKLTEDYPELPEPYNNLAVLYASQAQFDKAKNALEMAIRTHPSYGTAHENLGDVYAKLASQAYSKALQLDGSNTTAQSKLALIRDLITVNMRTPKTASKTEPARVAGADPAKLATGKTMPPPEPASKPALIAATTPALPAAAKTETPGASAGDSDEIVKVLREWAAAWSAKDVPAYLVHYAKNFKTPGNQSRADWENARKIRIQTPKSISVTLDSIKVKSSSNGMALVTFHQNYKSDTLKSMGAIKTVTMTKAGGKWQILDERVGN